MDNELEGRGAQAGLLQIVARLELGVALIDLDDLTIAGISTELAARLGAESATMLGTPLLGWLRAQDREPAQAALAAVASGGVDFYRTTRVIESPASADGMTAIAWVRAVDLDGRRTALIEVSFGQPLAGSPLAEYLGNEPLDMAVGTLDSEWVIKSISREAEAIMGGPAEEIIGNTLLHPDARRDVRRVFEQCDDGSEVHALALRIQWPDNAGEPRTLRVVVTSLVGRPECLFIVMREPRPTSAPDSADRTAALERHLRAIAAEVDASGVLVRMGGTSDIRRLPQVQSLTVRQWEVLNRLLRGERVPTIAADLFVSQSTVRNHLSTIFERFGVHSQPELLKLLRGSDDLSG